jgi:hypothetical protein
VARDGKRFRRNPRQFAFVEGGRRMTQARYRTSSGRGCSELFRSARRSGADDRVVTRTGIQRCRDDYGWYYSRRAGLKTRRRSVSGCG